MNGIFSLMAPWIFSPFTGNFDYYQAGGTTDPSLAVSNLQTQEGGNLLTQSGGYLLLQG